MALRACLAGLIGALLFALPAAAVTVGSTVLVDRPSGFGTLPFDGAGSSQVDKHVISGDGCFVVFESTADSLVQTDDNAAFNVFRVDRCTAGNPLVQVNTTSAGAPSEASSAAFAPSISNDGRYVAFLSNSHVLDAAATSGGLTQVFVKDLQTGALELASRATGPNGAPVTVDAVNRAVITGNGQFVVFTSTGPLDADNVDGVAGESDLYARDLLAHTTHMLSLTTAGVAGHGISAFSFDVDDVANRVVFASSKKYDTVADTDSGTDAYVRLGIGSSGESTQLVSSSGGGQPAGADSAFQVAMAPDGGWVAYSTAQHLFRSMCLFSCGNATQLDAPRTGGTNSGFPQDPFFAPADSTVGRVYWTTTSGLDPADTDGLKDLYGRDLADPAANTAIHLMSGAVA